MNSLQCQSKYNLALFVSFEFLDCCAPQREESIELVSNLKRNIVYRNALFLTRMPNLRFQNFRFQNLCVELIFFNRSNHMNPISGSIRTRSRRSEEVENRTADEKETYESIGWWWDDERQTSNVKPGRVGCWRRRRKKKAWGVKCFKVGDSI